MKHLRNAKKILPEYNFVIDVTIDLIKEYQKSTCHSFAQDLHYATTYINPSRVTGLFL